VRATVRAMSNEGGSNSDLEAEIASCLELPLTPWLELQYAVNFALHGLAFYPKFASIEGLQKIDAVLGGKPPGAILYGVGGHDYNAYTLAVGEFERRLSKAAFERRVRLQGIGSKQSTPTRQEIGSEYFAQPRGLAAGDATGGDDIESEPLDAPPAARARLTTDWRNCLVERSGFVAWLAQAYPNVPPQRIYIHSHPTSEWSDYLPSGRDEVLDRARQGEISPLDAEEWARHNDQPPFASTPTADRFDPMAEPCWSLSMAAAWIIWRAPVSVRHHWNKFRRECRDWGCKVVVYPDGRKKMGWVVDERKPSSLSRTLNGRITGSVVVSPIACHRELWLRFLAGELSATGIAHGQKDRVVIPKHDWIDLEPFAPWDANAIGVKGEGKPRYNSVSVTRAEVMALWEPLPAPVSPVNEYLARVAERSAPVWNEPFWTVWNSLSWIAFQDRDRLCRIEDSDDFRQVISYESHEMKEREPNRVLRDALRRGAMKALGPDGAEIPAARWAFVKTVWEMQCVFRREDVLRLWPESGRGRQPSTVVHKPLSEGEARQLIRDVAAGKGDFISLAEGAQILKERDPSMKRDWARSIVKSVIGNEKRGPKGPRRNSAK
jgi:hypothetical protein